MKHSKPWFYNKGLDRLQIVKINRIRSNHYTAAFSLFRKNMSDSPLCSCDENKVEDLSRILWSCPKYEVFRTQMTQSLSRMNLDPLSKLKN